MAPKRKGPKRGGGSRGGGDAADDAGGGHTLGSCMAAIGVADPAAALSGCADLAEEFSILKKAFHRKILKDHPDKGGDAGTFRATRSAFEVIRDLYESAAVPSFATAAARPTGAAYGTARATTGAGVPSWEFYAAAADDVVPRHCVELAKSGRAKCKAMGVAKHCADVVIEKGAVRVGTLDPEAGSYGRWVHLDCYRVPSKVWLGIPDPAKCKDVSVFEECLMQMGGVQLAGMAELPPEARKIFAEHVMDKSKWARLQKRKSKPESEATEAAGGAAQPRKRLKTEALASNKGGALADEGGSSGALVTTKAEPTKFVVPVAGQGLAVRSSLQGETVVLTGLFPEVGGGTGLSLGKARTKALVESFGGRVTSSVSGKTTLLVVGKQPGMGKVTQASSKGVRMMGLQDLADGLKVGHLKSADELGPMQIDSFSKGYHGNGLALKLTGAQQERAMRVEQPSSRKALKSAPAKRKRS